MISLSNTYTSGNPKPIKRANLVPDYPALRDDNVAMHVHVPQQEGSTMRAPNGRFVKVTITTLPDGNRGRNKRGICAHKTTKGAKKAKRQHVPGWQPQEVTAYKPNLGRA